MFVLSSTNGSPVSVLQAKYGPKKSLSNLLLNSKDSSSMSVQQFKRLILENNDHMNAMSSSDIVYASILKSSKSSNGVVELSGPQ